MKQPKFQFNDRVDFKDSESNFHVGYVKKIRRARRGWFKREWVYDICEYVKGSGPRKVFIIPERDIFGIVEFKNEKQAKQNECKVNKVYNDFSELKELK